MAKTGSNIYKRKDGRYEGRILVGKNCCRKSQYIYVYARTLKEVRQKMEEAREQKQPDEDLTFTLSETKTPAFPITMGSAEAFFCYALSL